jgi:hypothetical protein
MTQQLESDLRAALSERAAQVPAASIARLAGLDYKPRVRRLRPPVAIGAVASAAGAAGAVAVVISLSAGASNAFAGWTPTPTAPSPGQLSAALASCQTQSPVSGLPLKLTDTRGPFTFSIYADSSASATCIEGPSLTAVSGSQASAPVNVPAGHILLFSSTATHRSGAAYSFADGRAGDGVSAVTLTLDDGSKVQATVANGWYVAWWPSAHEVGSADITTASGVTTQTFGRGAEGGPGVQSGRESGGERSTIISGAGAAGSASGRGTIGSYSSSQ